MKFAPAHTLNFPKDQVAITLGRGLFGSHLGVAFHTANEGLKVLHLRFHKDLATDHFPDPNYIWIGCVVDLPSRASAALVGILRGLTKKRPNIGYGLNFLAGKGSFSPNGSYKAPKGSDGFTCSTFVVELFRNAALPLINEKTWESNSVNLAWGEAVCCLLENIHPTDVEHVAEVRKNNLGLRVRPEEVAAAANLNYSDRPVDFSVAISSAHQILFLLDASCPVIEVPQRFQHCVAIYEGRIK